MLKADFDDIFINEPMDEFVNMFRDAADIISTNVPHIVRHHSDYGYDFGNEYPGAADLALNIIENILRQIGYKGTTMIDTSSQNTVFLSSWDLHQDFSETFITQMPIEGGKFFVNELIIWVRGRLPLN